MGIFKKKAEVKKAEVKAEVKKPKCTKKKRIEKFLVKLNGRELELYQGIRDGLSEKAMAKKGFVGAYYKGAVTKFQFVVDGKIDCCRKKN